MYTVEFKKLPNFQKLFLDYISPDEEHNQIFRNYFNAGFRDNEGFFKVIESKIKNYNSSRYFDKSNLIEILKRQNVSFGGNEITAANIEKLKNDNTFAVVTGQQVGLYTGNFYTILKTITAIKLAASLNENFPQYNFIPVFWLESEDHDFEESNHIHIINKQNELVRIGFPAEDNNTDEESKKNTRPVGNIVFDNSINELNEQLRINLTETDFKSNLFEEIKSFYKEGNDFKHSFAQFLNWIFKENGIVFIDPSGDEIKNLLAPIFEKELTTSPKLCEEIIHTSAELEKNYDLQVKPKVINLFYINNGSRYLIEPRDNNMFALRNSKKRFEAGELMTILKENPERFSPNVVLRPICQDYLLPTVTYVGGPAEISYFAQFQPAYKHYDITMPVIFPRASVTILENKINKFLKNFEINFNEIFHHKTLITKVVNKLSEIKIEDEFTKAQDEFNKIFYDLKAVTSKIDKSLVNSLENLKQRFNSNLELFKSKLNNAQALKSDTTTSQIDKVTNNIYPNKNLQERVINVCYFLNKYNDALISKLFSEVDIYNFNHQVIEL